MEHTSANKHYIGAHQVQYITPKKQYVQANTQKDSNSNNTSFFKKDSQKDNHLNLNEYQNQPSSVQSKYNEENSNLKLKTYIPFSTPECKENAQKGQNFLFKHNDYSSNSLNLLLGSDLKFKSPNKLMSLKICESPWISNEKRNSFLSQFFENSPSIKNSNYKIRFTDTIKQESRVTSCFGRAGSRDIKFSGDFELNAGERYYAQKEEKVVRSGATQARRVPQVQSSLNKRQEIRLNSDEKSQGGSDKDENYEVRKRRRKSAHQLRVLKLEFDKSQNWTKEQITKISKMTELTESQVYKWCWDQKKKGDEVSVTKPEGENSEQRDKEMSLELGEMKKRFMNKQQQSKFGGSPQRNYGAEFTGKRKPFTSVNDSRVGNGLRDCLVKKIKML